MSKQVIIIDDDVVFCEALSRAFIKRDYQTHTVNDLKSLAVCKNLKDIDYAVVDLRLGAESGLDAIKLMLGNNPEIKIVMLTAYASIATTVEAMKLGAVNYLAKPASVQDIIDKLGNCESNEYTSIEEAPLSVKRLEWEHLQRVLLEHDGNVSAAARSLNMHRRTLQRKLQKYPVKR